MDPFAPFKFIAMCYRWWLSKIGMKWLVILFTISTIVVLILGCRETYGGG